MLSWIFIVMKRIMDRSCLIRSAETALCSKGLVDVYSGTCWISGEQMVYMIIAFCSPQVPELFGPIRTIAEGRGETVLIGTTKHFVLQGSLDGEFMPITQVDSSFKFVLLQYHTQAGGISFSM